jgi:hypothetical protein
VRFFHGSTAREIPVGIDDDTRSLAYSVIESASNLRCHDASAQVFPITGERTRFVWITDVLPDEIASRIGMMLDHAIARVKETQEARR